MQTPFTFLCGYQSCGYQHFAKVEMVCCFSFLSLTSIINDSTDTLHCTSKTLNADCSRVNKNILSVLFPGVGKVWIEINQQPEQACEFAEAVI